MNKAIHFFFKRLKRGPPLGFFLTFLQTKL